jgi:hypothetical protein
MAFFAPDRDKKRYQFQNENRYWEPEFVHWEDFSLQTGLGLKQNLRDYMWSRQDDDHQQPQRQ